MDWEVLSKIDAAGITKEWQEMNTEDFSKLVDGWNEIINKDLNEDYLSLRNKVIQSFSSVTDKIEKDELYKKKKDYYTDLLFGIEFYEILKSYGFSVRMASNDQVWMYLCVKVFPDIVHSRYPGVKSKTSEGVVYKNVNEERFWKTRRRIYLKVLWWYIYLSLQKDDNGNDDLKYTFEILKGNSTDEIVQIVERSGEAGYRVGVYRELMRYYSQNRDIYDNKNFRQVMVLNTAKTKIVEPELIDGGVPVYIKELFDFV